MLDYQVGDKNLDSPTKAFNQYLKKHFSLAIQQRIFLLLKREDKKIKQFRTEWHIPDVGFASEEEGKSWWQDLAKIAPEKLRDVVYLEVENIYLLNKFVSIGKISSTNFEVFPRYTIAENDIHAVFDQELKKLLVQLNIDQELLPVLRDYMTWNGASPSAVKDTGIMVSERLTYIPGFGEIERRISLTFGPNTDGPDLQDIYKYFVKGLQQTITGHLKGLSKNQKEFDRNLMIITWHNQGAKPKEIADKLEEDKIYMDEAAIRRVIKRISAYSQH